MSSKHYEELVNGIMPEMDMHDGDKEAVVQAFRAFLEAGADVDKSYETQSPLGLADTESPLHLAAWFDLPDDVLEGLVSQRGADLNVMNFNDNTPLHLAAREGDVRYCKALVEAGADINFMNSCEEAPLHLAVFESQVPAIEALIELGADINARDDRGRTPLHHSLVSGGLPNTDAIVKMFIANGAEVNTHDKRGDTPLHTAAEWGLKDVCQMLIEAGADPDAMSKDGSTVFNVVRGEAKTYLQSILDQRQFEASTAKIPDRFRTDDWAPSPDAEANGLARIRASQELGGDEIQVPTRSRAMRL